LGDRIYKLRGDKGSIAEFRLSGPIAGGGGGPTKNKGVVIYTVSVMKGQSGAYLGVRSLIDACPGRGLPYHHSTPRLGNKALQLGGVAHIDVIDSQETRLEGEEGASP